MAGPAPVAGPHAAASKRRKRPWCGRCSHEPWPRRPVPVGLRAPLHDLVRRPRSTSRVGYRPQHLYVMLLPADAFPRRVIPFPPAPLLLPGSAPGLLRPDDGDLGNRPVRGQCHPMPPLAVNEFQKLHDGAHSGGPPSPPAHAPIRHRITPSLAAGSLWKLHRSGTSLTPCTLGHFSAKASNMRLFGQAAATPADKACVRSSSRRHRQPPEVPGVGEPPARLPAARKIRTPPMASAQPELPQAPFPPPEPPNGLDSRRHCRLGNQVRHADTNVFHPSHLHPRKACPGASGRRPPEMRASPARPCCPQP